MNSFFLIYIIHFLVECFISNELLVGVALFSQPVCCFQNGWLLSVSESIVHHSAFIFLTINVVLTFDLLLSSLKIFLKIVARYIWRLFGMTTWWQCCRSLCRTESRRTYIIMSLVVNIAFRLGGFFRFIIPIVHKCHKGLTSLKLTIIIFNLLLIVDGSFFL